MGSSFLTEPCAVRAVPLTGRCRHRPYLGRRVPLPDHWGLFCAPSNRLLRVTSTSCATHLGQRSGIGIITNGSSVTGPHWNGSALTSGTIHRTGKALLTP